MALIKCPECQSEVSDKAKTCPKCGYPIDEIAKNEPSSTGMNICPKCGIVGGIYFGILVKKRFGHQGPVTVP